MCLSTQSDQRKKREKIKFLVFLSASSRSSGIKTGDLGASLASHILRVPKCWKTKEWNKTWAYSQKVDYFWRKWRCDGNIGDMRRAEASVEHLVRREGWCIRECRAPQYTALFEKRRIDSHWALTALSILTQGHCHRAITAEAEPRLSKMQSLQPLCTTSTDLWCRERRSECEG